MTSGSYVNGVYIPAVGEVGWGLKVDDALNQLASQGVNVQAAVYGATGDGTTDDTDSIQAAIDAVTISTSPYYGWPLWFPYGSYKFGALDWNWSPITGHNTWQKVYISGELKPQVTMQIPASRFTFEGVSGSPHTSFDFGAGAEINGAALGSNPTINLFGTSTSVQLKNLAITEVVHTGITVEQGVCNVFMENISVNLGGASTGSCIQFDGGFGYTFRNCNFNAGTGGSAGPALKFYNADGTDPLRIIWMQECFFGSRGVYIASGAGSNVGSQNVFDRILMEGSKEAFLTIDSTFGFQTGFNLRNIEVADSTLGTQALIKNTGTNTYNINVEGCAGINDLIESGSDRVNGLRFREAESNGISTIGQTKYYESVGRFGQRDQAAPFCRPSGTADTSTGGSLDCGDGNTFTLSASGARSVTAFTNQKPGQNLTILFTNGNTTIKQGANVKLAGGVDFVGTSNDVLRLLTDGTTVYEISRSVN